MFYRIIHRCMRVISFLWAETNRGNERDDSQKCEVKTEFSTFVALVTFSKSCLGLSFGFVIGFVVFCFVLFCFCTKYDCTALHYWNVFTCARRERVTYGKERGKLGNKEHQKRGRLFPLCMALAGLVRLCVILANSWSGLEIAVLRDLCSYYKESGLAE